MLLLAFSFQRNFTGVSGNSSLARALLLTVFGMLSARRIPLSTGR